MEVQLSCVVIDDNDMNRLTLEHFVGLTSGLELRGSFADGLQALTYLRSAPPVDVLLLDIDMPYLSGLELLEVLPQPHPAVILVTSHREFALEAYALRVLDYLVKPVPYARFVQAIERLRATTSPRQPGAATLPKADAAHLYVKTNGKLLRLNFDDVLYIEALSTYVTLVTEKQKYIVHSTLKALEDRLPFAHFQRVHRSYVVNTHHIRSVQDNMLQLGSHEVPIGRSYQEEFLRSLKGL